MVAVSPAPVAHLDSATPWFVPVSRAAVALVLAAVVTFNADHSSVLGFTTFGLFTVITGALLTASGLRSTSHGPVRTITLVQGIVSVLFGIVALAVITGGLPFLVLLVTAWAVITGFLELYLGVRGRGTDASARDWIFAGGLTALLAVAVLLVPPGYLQHFTGPDGVERELTASIIVVGALGAYWVILGVYLVIAGLSLKWSRGAAAGAGEK